ncbi:unnamed protein product [Phaedon cochleariae]|uniref:Uncharacterized protein n=1 Tax=Phaedon cochleariae TaxID=80249 RepID=A0A9N9SI21_PHACE|nr:unnamed protein product [Phaedon cochleariae]
MVSDEVSDDTPSIKEGIAEVVAHMMQVLAIVCLGLHYKSVTNDLNTDIISAAAFGGYIIILIGGFSGHLMTTPFNRRIDIFFCLAGCALFVAAGAMNIKIYQDYGKSEWRDYGLAKGSLAIINGALFLLDSLLMYNNMDIRNNKMRAIGCVVRFAFYFFCDNDDHEQPKDDIAYLEREIGRMTSDQFKIHFRTFEHLLERLHEFHVTPKGHPEITVEKSALVTI